MWPQGLTEIPKEDPIPSTLDWDLWLGCAEKRPFTAAGKTDPDPNGGFFYQPFNWRGFYDFGCGALGDMACHILGAPNMALHLSKRKVIGVECVKKEGASPFMFPKASVIRFDFAACGNMPALKIFWYDGLGASLYAKRLERGRFVWPSTKDGVVTITPGQLGYLLEEIDWRHPQRTWRPELAGCGRFASQTPVRRIEPAFPI